MNLVRNSRLYILLVVVLTAASCFQVRDLRVAFSLENFFPANDPELESFREFQDRFYARVDDEYLLVALHNEAGIFQKDFLEKADSLTRYIASLEHIVRVYSITDIPAVRLEAGELVRDSLIHIGRPEAYDEDSISLFRSEEYRGLLFSADGRDLAVTALNTPRLTNAEKDLILDRIDAVLKALNFDDARVAGKIKVERTYAKHTTNSLARYLAVSFLLMAVVLALIYRSAVSVVVPLAASAIAILWTLALIAALDRPIDVVSSLLPPVLAVICLSDIIHITTGYLERSRNGMNRRQVLKSTFSEIGPAILITSLTTAAGFLSLCISNVSTIRSFGLVAGIGVLIALAAAVMTTYPAYDLVPLSRIARGKPSGERWTKLLSGAYDAVVPGKRTIVAVFILLMIPSAYLVSRIETDSSLLQELPDNEPLLADFEFIEERFSGTRAFELELILEDPSRSFLEPAILRQVDAVEDFLEDSLGIGSIFSPVTFIKGANRALNGGSPEAFTLPEDRSEVNRCFDRLLFSPAGGDMIRFITQDAKHARISGKLPNISLREAGDLQDRLLAFLDDRDAILDFQAHPTGSALLIDRVSVSAVRDLFTGLAIGISVISLILSFMFRSLRIAAIAIVVNLVPLVFVAAAMGALGIYLKADTAMVFAIAFGIAVDDSIHFISRFRREKALGHATADAVRRTYLSTGKAMIISTIVLLAGFLSLIFSSFGSVSYIGILVSLCLVFAGLTDLTLLPALLLWSEKQDDQRT